MTERLFEQDSYCREFKAVVKEVVPEEDIFRIVLDRTAFFPEGGGQSADSGTLNDLQVLDVQEQDGQIYHMVNKPLETGAEVYGAINWPKRYVKMQQHSGEHIVSGLVQAKFGYNNIGFHLGSESCTMDFDGLLTKEQIKTIEILANEVIYENLQIEVLYPNKAELGKLHYRSKIEIEGQIRLVCIPGYDLCACCAPHLNRTGEIGLIKLIGLQNYKGGVRVTMVCGRRALADYERKEESVKEISAALSAKEEAVSEAVDRLKQENESLKQNLYKQQMILVNYKAKVIDADNQVICCFESELDGEAPRELVNRLVKKGARLCAVFFYAADGGYRYVLGGSQDDVRPVGRKLDERFQGRGGGSPQMVQGMVKGEKEDICRFFDEYR